MLTMNWKRWFLLNITLRDVFIKSGQVSYYQVTETSVANKFYESEHKGVKR